MYGSLLSILLLGMVPMWGAGQDLPSVSAFLRIAPPTASQAVSSLGSTLPRLSASGVVVMDIESGQVAFAKQASIQRPMASLTKLMTALLIVEHHALDEQVTVPGDIGQVIGNVAHLPPGEHFTVGDLLSALLVMSANDAAVTLAEFHSGSAEAFVAEMNERAKELGLVHTSYENPAGFDAPTQYSSPQDLAWLAMFVQRFPAIADRMALPSARIGSREGSAILLTSTHLLLQTEDIVVAGKTGTTDAAKQCLLTILEYAGRRYVVVLLHSSDRYGDLRHVLASLSS